MLLCSILLFPKKKEMAEQLKGAFFFLWSSKRTFNFIFTEWILTECSREPSRWYSGLVVLKISSICTTWELVSSWTPFHTYWTRNSENGAQLSVFWQVSHVILMYAKVWQVLGFSQVVSPSTSSQPLLSFPKSLEACLYFWSLKRWWGVFNLECEVL